jgi:RNA polymerase primary sigma factor
MANQSKTIRLPVHLVDKIYKLNRASLKIREELGREPTDEELSEEIGISRTKLSQLKTVWIRPASLDAPISDDDSTNLARLRVMKMRGRRSSCLERRTYATNLASFWRCWTTTSAGLSSSDSDWTAANRKLSKNLEKKFGATRERIRQLQNIALAELSRALAKREKPIVYGSAVRRCDELRRWVSLRHGGHLSKFVSKVLLCLSEIELVDHVKVV